MQENISSFDDQGNFDWTKTEAKLAPKLAKTNKAVIPGFYGSMPNGQLKTFQEVVLM